MRASAAWSAADDRSPKKLTGVQFAIGADYSLSKRTALYGTYSAIDNEATSDFKVLGASSALSPGNNSQGVQFGVRHTF